VLLCSGPAAVFIGPPLQHLTMRLGNNHGKIELEPAGLALLSVVSKKDEYFFIKDRPLPNH
jgi:hypothetical protein